jgi:hypothetical protein
LTAAGGQDIACYGEQHQTICLDGRDFQWTFLLAKVEMPLLGADFLRHYQLLVDLSGGCLLEAGTLARIGNGSCGSGSGELYSVLEQTPPEIRAVLSKFPEVINASKRLPEVKHTVVHIIETTG